MAPAEFQTAIAAVSAFSGALAGTGILTWWLASRFSNVYRRINEVEARLKENIGSVKEVLSTKIDDHEKLDLERFGKQEITIMRIELALQKGGTPLHGI